MKLPEYVTAEEVRRVCRELNISDWTTMREPLVSDEEAAVILEIVNTGEMEIALEDFRRGLEVELEHGIMYEDANVTNNHPVLTGKIVLAHLKETLDYYQRLEIAELEGDLLKAIAMNDLKKIKSKYERLAVARNFLAKTEADVLKKQT